MSIDGERGAKICRQVFLAEMMGIEKNPSGADEYTQGRCLRAASDQIWLQRFRTGDLSCSDLICAGRPPLTLRPQVDAFLQKYLFASAGIITKHFLTTVSTIKTVPQRELGMKKFSQR
jgi:hypothetical protein